MTISRQFIEFIFSVKPKLLFEQLKRRVFVKQSLNNQSKERFCAKLLGNDFWGVFLESRPVSGQLVTG